MPNKPKEKVRRTLSIMNAFLRAWRNPFRKLITLNQINLFLNKDTQKMGRYPKGRVTILSQNASMR
jgi:hypothetical protein